MFRTLSENKDRPRGKRSDENTFKQKLTTYQVGRSEW